MLLGELREEIKNIEYKMEMLSSSINDSMSTRDMSYVQDTLSSLCEELKNKKLLLQDIITKVSVGEEGSSSQLHSLIELSSIKFNEIKLYENLLLTSYDKSIIIDHLSKVINEYRTIKSHIERTMWTTRIGKEE